MTGRRSAVAVALLALLLLVPFLGARQVRNPDEPREAEIAREAAAGDWSVVPELNGEPFLEHPPLFSWMSAAGILAAGEPTDASARAASVAMGVVTVLATWMLAEVLLGAGAGWTAALLVLAAPYLFLQFRRCLADTGLAAFTTLSLALFFRAYVRRSPADALLAGVAAGLAFLCKGLLGYGIPAVVAGSFLVARRDLGAVLRLRLWLAALAGLGLGAPWVLALHAAEGTAGLHRFFVWNHFGRFGADADHAKPVWYHAKLLVAALPLTPLALAAALGRIRETGEPRGTADRRATDAGPAVARLAGLCWVLAPLLVLSVASGKRTIYLLPLFPGLALLATCALRAADAGALRPRLLALVRGTVGGLRAVTLTFPFRRGTSPGRAVVPACVALAVAALAVDAFVLPRTNATASGYAVAAQAEALSAGRPIVLYRVGEGDVGQFTFALRRRLPSAANAEQLAVVCGEGSAVVLAADDVIEASGPAGRRAALSRLRPLGRGTANEEVWGIWEWPAGDAVEDAPPLGAGDVR